MCDTSGCRGAFKQKYAEEAIACLRQYFNLTANLILHQAGATPLTFSRYTGRYRGIVRGIIGAYQLSGDLDLPTEHQLKTRG